MGLGCGIPTSFIPPAATARTAQGMTITQSLWAGVNNGSFVKQNLQLVSPKGRNVLSFYLRGNSLPKEDFVKPGPGRDEYRT